jgi:hypothetical protein
MLKMSAPVGQAVADASRGAHTTMRKVWAPGVTLNSRGEQFASLKMLSYVPASHLL